MASYIIFFVVGNVIIFLIVGLIYFVEEKTVVIIQRLGKFHKVSNAGINFKIPLIDQRAALMNLKMQQMDVVVETKTQDNVFVSMEVSVQYQVKTTKVYDAYYRLNDPKSQINSYVYDVVRASVPKMKLDEVFEKKDDIAKGIKESLDKTMDEFGYDIINALVTDIDPDEKVKVAMNRINAAQRDREAAEQEGESAKIKVVKAAEAEAESKKLQGMGIAGQRKAIVEGLKESVKDMADATKIDSKEVLNMVLMTQYFDTMKDLGTQNAKVIFMPSNPASLAGLKEEMISAIESTK